MEFVRVLGKGAMSYFLATTNEVVCDLCMISAFEIDEMPWFISCRAVLGTCFRKIER